ncbi:hypothetical protein [Halomarina oriensis]|uniref:DUF7979 domain-containing protein n=1 Tax=Halomarina oriensis TaxID=671145 RepID=A0A6B0GMC2_9EURY|nr:hypothetical protein [Halomarina oriensis]MWG35061.1 hypothetical protein [Halomarina oriensis]
MPSRRRLLAGVGALGASALAGCVSDDSAGSTPVPDELRATRVPPEEFPDAAGVAVVPTAIREAFVDAFDGGVADIEWETVDDPVETTVGETLVQRGDATYEVVVETALHAEYGAEFVRHDGSWTPDDGRAVVAYADLSAGGRAAFDHALDVGRFESGGHVEPPWGADWPNRLPPVRHEGSVYEFEAGWVGDPPPHTTVWARKAPDTATGPVHDVAFPRLASETHEVLRETTSSGRMTLDRSGRVRDELEALVTDYDFVAFEEYYELTVLTADD